jgi:hypothetical protein
VVSALIFIASNSVIHCKWTLVPIIIRIINTPTTVWFITYF